MPGNTINPRRAIASADLTDALDAKRIAVVKLIDEDDLDVLHVRVYRHGDVGVDDATELVIDEGFPQAAPCRCPKRRAKNLAVCSLGVQDASWDDAERSSRRTRKCTRT